MFRKDRGMDRSSRPKSAQRGTETPKLEPSKGAAAGPTLNRGAGLARRPASVPDAALPGASSGGPLARPAAGAMPNRLTALLGEPVTRPVSQNQDQMVSEPRRETGKRMHIGQDISISGEISTCDVLVIDGHVDATVRDCGRLEIGPAGTLRGDIEVRNAEIGGRFDGELKVSDRLTVRGTGRVSGVVRYGRLEVTVGGQLRGDIAPAEPAQAEAGTAEGAAAAAAGAALTAGTPERPDQPARPSAASILKPQPDGSPAGGSGSDPAEAEVTGSSSLRTIAEALNRNAAE
ncbi:MAG: polymer-forming cytoskeletal protein [Alphaproteobacteria bacterium]